MFLSGDAGAYLRNHSMKPSRTGAQKGNYGKHELRYGHPLKTWMVMMFPLKPVQDVRFVLRCFGFPVDPHLELQAAAIRRVSEFVPQGKDSVPNLGDTGFASYGLHEVLFGWFMCNRFVEFGVNFGKACKCYQDILRRHTGWRLDGRHLGQDAELRLVLKRDVNSSRRFLLDPNVWYNHTVNAM